MSQAKKYKIWIFIWATVIIAATVYWFYTIYQNKTERYKSYSIAIQEEASGNFITENEIEKALKPFLSKDSTKDKKLKMCLRICHSL